MTLSTPSGHDFSCLAAVAQINPSYSPGGADVGSILRETGTLRGSSLPVRAQTRVGPCVRRGGSVAAQGVGARAPQPQSGRVMGTAEIRGGKIGGGVGSYCTRSSWPNKLR